MSKYSDIEENEIRVIGAQHGDDHPKPRFPKAAMICCAAALLVLIIVLAFHAGSKKGGGIATPQGNNNNVETQDVSVQEQWLSNDDSRLPAATLRSDTVIDGVRMMLLRPMNAEPKLSIGHLDTNDNSIIFAALAADIRRDNGKIVGAFVCDGEPRAWGLSKKGYCAIINGFMAIGVADDSPYFERATETGGFFFRQYPAVSQHQPMSNNPENKSFRRAVCSLGGDIAIAVSHDRVLMNDFSNALARLGVDNAIFLVGGQAFGWYIDKDGHKVRLSDETAWNMPNTNFIYFRKK